MKILKAFAMCAGVGVAGCAGVVSDDPSAAEFGTYQEALATSSGAPACDSPKKVLVCHRPPGNPANAHSICIGEPAVAAHLKHHPDNVGPCAPGTDGQGSGSGGGSFSGQDGGGVLIEGGGGSHSGADAGGVVGSGGSSGTGTGTGSGGGTGTGGGSADAGQPPIIG